MSKLSDKTDKNKKAMIIALEKYLGVVTDACKSVNIARQTHYEWYKEDAEYKAAVDDVSEIALDFAETQLYNQIKAGEVASTLFYLKTKGKRRGYVERSEVESTHKFENLPDWMSTNESEPKAPDS